MEAIMNILLVAIKVGYHLVVGVSAIIISLALLWAILEVLNVAKRCLLSITKERTADGIERVFAIIDNFLTNVICIGVLIFFVAAVGYVFLAIFGG